MMAALTVRGAENALTSFARASKSVITYVPRPMRDDCCHHQGMNTFSTCSWEEGRLQVKR